MRIIAAGLALAAFVWAGRAKCRKLRRKAEFPGEIVMMLNDFSAQINYGSPTLEQLLERSENVFAKRVCELLREKNDVKEAWSAACGELDDFPEERELLRELFGAISACGAQGAEAALRLYSERFSRLEAAARENYLKKGAAAKKIGALCGAAAAIFFL